MTHQGRNRDQVEEGQKEADEDHLLEKDGRDSELAIPWCADDRGGGKRYGEVQALDVRPCHPENECEQCKDQEAQQTDQEIHARTRKRHDHVVDPGILQLLLVDGYRLGPPEQDLGVRGQEDARQDDRTHEVQVQSD